jgi:dolichol-phosphate mannosyltransferase
LRVLIAVPVYNERNSVARVLGRILSHHGEVLAIDDGSTDGTSDVLLGRDDIHLVRHTRNMGYGRSLIDAFNFADSRGFDWVLTMDCDEQHEPRSIPDFLREIDTDRWDIVSGSRYLAPREDNDLPPSDRRSINAVITEVLNDSLGLHLTDSFCGFKAHRTSAMMKLNLSESGYGFPMQFWPRAAFTGLRISEVPVRLIYNDPNRHFGGRLDDAAYRLRHYLSILGAEMTREPADYLACTCR